MAWLAVVLAAVIVVGVFVAAKSNRLPTGVHTVSRVTPSRAAAATPPDALSTVAFDCSGSTGLGVAGAPPVAYVSAVRVTKQVGYDRVTIEFANGRPGDVVLSTQPSANFTKGPGGQPVALKGQDGALVTIHGSDGHTEYRGPADVKTGYSTVVELRQVQDFEGTVQWAIGLSRVACYRVAFLDNPVRLVMDFQAGPKA
jgi:hypothetical protein